MSNEHSDRDTIAPSVLLRDSTDEPLTEEQMKNKEAAQKEAETLELDDDSKIKDLTRNFPQVPGLKDDDVSSLKRLLDTIMNDERGVERRIDYEYYNNNRRFFSQFMDYTINNTISTMDLKKFINRLTNFNYDPFEGIRANMLFSVQDRLLYIHELGKVFNHDFLGNIDIQFKMHNIDGKLAKFIKREAVPFNDFEHRLIKTMIGKMLLSIFSNIERAFIQENHCLSSDYLMNIKDIDMTMHDVCYSDKYVMKSWNAFMNKLTDTKTLYRFNGYEELTEKLKLCYDNKFPIEIFMADCVKAMIPSIGLNYINAVKSVYLMGRLMSIYINKYMQKRCENGNAERIRLTDMVVICRSVMVDYESNYFATSMIPRSMPKMEENMSEEMKLYYISHTLTGPQYYLLKQLEYTLPCLKYI
jgi:hypothetical protein